MRQPQDIKSALALSSIILQANQNMQHGGQSLAMFDIDLAPYVRKTFEKQEKVNRLSANKGTNRSVCMERNRKRYISSM